MKKTQLCDATESTADLQNQIWGLEESLDDLEHMDGETP